MTASTFDISLLEHLVPLCRGVRVVIAPEEVVRDSHAIATLARRESVTSIQATPTAWASLRHELAATTRLLVGGEALSSSLARELLAIGREVWNLYGPTEATIWTSAHRVTAADAERSGVVAIGRPLYGYRVDVRDHALNACSSGELGQLYIVGGALARGYHDRPALTAERFRPDPCGAWGSRMYCTGDIGRIAADGTIEFSGRSDTQVKLRGTRIELGEIEAALESGKGVGRAAVILRQAPSGEPELAAYITTGGGLPADLDALRRDMIATLPRAMVPSAIIALDALPLTASGKVDRGRLKEFDVRGTRASSSVMTPTQEAIAALFKEVLGLPSIGLEEDFFDLGGHSMTAARLLNRVRARFGCELELDLLLTAGSVMGLAEVVEDVVGGRAPLTSRAARGNNTHP